jgi:signal transduction histidine kinase
VSETAEPDLAGRLDGDGVLFAASPELLALQMGAGGSLPGPVAIPSIAAVSRLAQTLGILVSRRVVAAVDHQIVDFLVRARPEGGGVALQMSALEGGAESEWAIIEDAESAFDFAELESQGQWRCDRELRTTSIEGDLTELVEIEALGLADGKLTSVFRLIEQESGDLPLLEGAILGKQFSRQLAELRVLPSIRLLLHGQPVTGPDGDFAGIRGGYRIVSQPSGRPVVQAEATVEADTGFAARLDLALRQPLARIIANADQIGSRVSGPLRSDYVDYAKDIAAAGRHLLAFVDDLADLQSIERADFSPDAEIVDLADICRRAAGLLAVRAADKGVRIDAPASDERLLARGDFRRILQIMVNLVGNAVRYSPERSSVWIRLEQEGDLAVIVVADQGKGIALADQARIFEKFERVDQAEPEGSGLGLFISRRLARAMGGDLTVDSAPGQGARFALTLPVSDASQFRNA